MRGTAGGRGGPDGTRPPTPTPTPTTVRVVVAAALVVVAVAVALALGRSTAPYAGSDHIVPAVFAAAVPPGGSVCQVNPYLPPGAAAAQVVLGSYGRPIPPLEIAFTDAAGARVAAGRLLGAREGTARIPIAPVPDAAAAARAVKVCLTVAGPATSVLVGGVGIPPDPTDETIDGVPTGGRISIIYPAAGGPTAWWSRLATIDDRFGLGKAAFFGGGWTLPACVVALLAAWALAVRLLVRGDR